MAGLCCVTPITGHKAYTGKEGEEEDIRLLGKEFTFIAPPSFDIEHLEN
jgi:hypothetical protein